MTISYELGNSLYINLTNRCSNDCAFCIRNDNDGLTSTDTLWLEREPGVDEIIEDLKKRDLKKYKEVVFCGFGEPFTRFDECVEVAKWLKSQGVRIRVNTNGQANLIHGRDVTGEMKGLFDTVSISLNGKSAAEYNEACRSIYGEKAYDALLDFGRKCAQNGIETIFTVVDILPKEDIMQCEEIAKSHGGKLRIRKYIKGQG